MSFAFDATKYRNQWSLPPWNAAMDDALRTGWLAGKAIAQIVDDITAISGVELSNTSLYKRAHRLNLRNRDSSWTQPIEADLVALHASGKSASVIRNDLNEKYGTTFTRNAVIGKQHRMGLAGRISTVTYKGRAAHGGARINAKPNRGGDGQVRANRVRRAKGLQKPVTIREEGAPAIIDLAIPHEQRKAFMDLGPKHCRWGVGDVGQPDFFFCGGLVKEDHSYCPGHFARAYRGKTR